MGKQKFVIQMNMGDLKMRSKVQQTVVKHRGVTLVKIEGDDHDKVVIEGEELDVVAITRSLRRKICHAEVRVLSVEEKKKEEKKDEEKKKEEKLSQCVCAVPYNPCMYPRYYDIPQDQPSCCVM
ncbi:hypothetical protein LUZ61_001991 [Rhynchospora tenuis]|uniref:HMA domain-containing protein n=1 Tax=Rhynchospora tenuis TaxID=198213 RepID=A0AAD5ZIA3_9POAL|nr:hypothetical protein LUZ61_001991 [Rhynchospora tenuis]